MQSEAILNLISDLYAQLLEAQRRIVELEQQVDAQQPKPARDNGDLTENRVRTQGA